MKKKKEPLQFNEYYNKVVEYLISKKVTGWIPEIELVAPHWSNDRSPAQAGSALIKKIKIS